MLRTPKIINPELVTKKNLSNVRHIVKALKGKFVVNSSMNFTSDISNTFGIAFPVESLCKND
jgi:hypothetical protein